jgi:hypothetical protein
VLDLRATTTVNIKMERETEIMTHRMEISSIKSIIKAKSITERIKYPISFINQ